jgi:hypothetical protein
LAQSIGNFVTFDVIKDIRSDLEGKAKSADLAQLYDENEVIKKKMSHFTDA